jgi:hypothetical protein
MPLRVTGLRLGVRLFTPSGLVTNGEITSKTQVEYLKGIGYRVESCAGVPEAVPTAAEREEIAAADRLLRRNTGDDGRTQLDKDITKGLSQLLAPLRKKTYRTTFPR